MEEVDLVQEGRGNSSSGDAARCAEVYVAPALQVILLGEASAIFGVREISVPLSEACVSIGDVLAVISEQYGVSIDKVMRPDFRFAHNGKLLQGDAMSIKNIVLRPRDELAILPPVTGG